MAEINIYNNTFHPGSTAIGEVNEYHYGHEQAAAELAALKNKLAQNSQAYLAAEELEAAARRNDKSLIREGAKKFFTELLKDTLSAGLIHFLFG